VVTAKVGRARECQVGPARLEGATGWIDDYRRTWQRRLDPSPSRWRSGSPGRTLRAPPPGRVDHGQPPLPGTPARSVRRRRNDRRQRLQSVLTVTLYLVIAATIAGTTFARRDVKA
jgi:hypothetical protein